MLLRHCARLLERFLIYKISKGLMVRSGLAAIFLFSFLLPRISIAKQDLPCLKRITPTDSLLVADSKGQALYKKNESKKLIPASTLKILTALTALDHFGASYRFRTEFYLDSDRNLKIKGYGDPLLISEVWQEIAGDLTEKVRDFNALILDDTYFERSIVVPGRKHSTNPYDAPLGALCANFNTVYFARDQEGNIISAEPQTPLIPFAREKISSLEQERGRYVLSHDSGEIAHYAGGVLLHFMRERGVNYRGKMRLGRVTPEDRLIYTYHSRFDLETVLKKMMRFSSNFMANQVFIALGAHVYGPPGTMAKGVKVVSNYAQKRLGMDDIEIKEGSGLSRRNHISALDMLVILRHFMPYRHILNRKGMLVFKTGSLRGIRTRAGYIEVSGKEPYCFVIFLNRPGPDIEAVLDCVKDAFADQ